MDDQKKNEIVSRVKAISESGDDFCAAQPALLEIYTEVRDAGHTLVCLYGDAIVPGHLLTAVQIDNDVFPLV